MDANDWVLGYRRRVLDHLGAPSDIELSTVTIVPTWTEDEDYEWIITDEGLEENLVDRTCFEIVVTWLHRAPAFESQRPEDAVPGERPLYRHTRTATNQQAAQLLLGLDPRSETAPGLR